jgi:DNA sulfur modification protein DndD
VRLVLMEMTNFGPYRGSQQFAFSEEPGVELIWGENGRGKTTFLNALRWVLFAVTLDRGSQRPLTRIGNRDEDDRSGVRPFKVVLTFTHNDHRYKLTRAYAKSSGSLISDDFKVTCSLVKDGDVLGPDERDRELSLLLPQQIARFFLFDAELLQEYEQLLTLGSEAGEKLKEAIERILGLPVLTQARDDVAFHLAAARKAQAKAAQQDRATRDIGNELQLASEEAESARRNLAELIDEADQQQNAVNELEKQLTNNNRFRGLMATRDAKRKERDRLEARAKERSEDLLAVTGEVWKAILVPAVHQELAAIEGRLDDLTQRLESAVNASLSVVALTSGTCPTCHQHVSPPASEALRHLDVGEDTETLQTELAALRGRRDTLQRLRADSPRIVRLEEELAQARVDLSDAESQLRELQDDLAQAPEGTEEAVTNLVGRHSQATIALSNTRTRLRQCREDVTRKDNAVAGLSAKLQRQGAPGSGEEARKVQVLDDLHRLLADAVNEFRDRLRDLVEAQATEVFRVLSAEPDYAGLRINDNYGLTILHPDGSEVIGRSSGYEHIVALSLIAALQRCSPMSGPMITDSPFGRLDKTHKEHVLRALPQITDQVLLLVHDDEIHRDVALEQLGTDLVAEHHLHRITSTHTSIEAGAYP